MLVFRRAGFSVLHGWDSVRPGNIMGAVHVCTTCRQSQLAKSTWPGQPIEVSILTVTHLSECGKEKLKTDTSFPSFDGFRINCPSDKRESRIRRHCNKASAASEARQRRSRRGNPDGLNKMHPGLAGLLHFVRNDGKGVMNYGSINSQVKLAKSNYRGKKP